MLGEENYSTPNNLAYTIKNIFFHLEVGFGKNINLDILC